MNINSQYFYNLSPYPLIITASEWDQYPEWKKAQLERDNEVLLNRNYTIEDLKNKTITFRYEFNQSKLLVNTPKNWVLPNSRFHIGNDVERIFYQLGESKSLFQFINETNNNKPTYKAFESKDLNKFLGYTINMDITLVKGSSTKLNTKTWELTTSKGLSLSLPTISESYSEFIHHSTNRSWGEWSSIYYQNIYFPMMLELGYANYDKYETYNKQFDTANNPGWDFIRVTVSYNKPTPYKPDQQLISDLSKKYLNL
jgi:hypothetical protein